MWCGVVRGDRHIGCVPWAGSVCGRDTSASPTSVPCPPEQGVGAQGRGVCGVVWCGVVRGDRHTGVSCTGPTSVQGPPEQGVGQRRVFQAHFLDGGAQLGVPALDGIRGLRATWEKGGDGEGGQGGIAHPPPTVV